MQHVLACACLYIWTESWLLACLHAACVGLCMFIYMDRVLVISLSSCSMCWLVHVYIYMDRVLIISLPSCSMCWLVHVYIYGQSLGY